MLIVQLGIAVLDNDKENTIANMRILAGCTIDNSIPTVLEEVQEIFGPLKPAQSIKEDSTIIFERTGLRISCELFGNPPKIKWLEFYPCTSK